MVPKIDMTHFGIICPAVIGHLNPGEKPVENFAPLGKRSGILCQKHGLLIINRSFSPT